MTLMDHKTLDTYCQTFHVSWEYIDQKCIVLMILMSGENITSSWGGGIKNLDNVNINLAVMHCGLASGH